VSLISVHSDRLERWLGAEAVRGLSGCMVGTYFDPIQLAILDGSVKVARDGDFVSRKRFDVGYEASYLDMADEMQRLQRRRAMARMARGLKQSGAISGINSIYTAIGAGKRQDMLLAKAGVTGVANIANSLWDVGSSPAAGSTSAAPGGSSPTNTTTGGVLYDNATGGDTMYFIGASLVSTVGNNFLLLYDRYFQVNHSLATDPQSVTGVPSRYQSTAARNTFIGVAVTTALGAGTPTYTITYVDSEGNTAETAAAQTIVASSIARRFPFAASVGNGWHIPLNAGDRGVREIDDLNLSAASTGSVDVFLGKPIAWIPMPVANMPINMDATLSPRDLVEIAASACLAFMEVNKGATTATSYSGGITLCSA
jgi:hypothetical protein